MARLAAIAETLLNRAHIAAKRASKGEREGNLF